LNSDAEVVVYNIMSSLSLSLSHLSTDLLSGPYFACRSPDDPSKSPVHEERFLFIETRKCSNLGISLVGGNAVGIFVHSVQPDSLAYNSGLR
jgi:hypothetical protein